MNNVTAAYQLIFIIAICVLLPIKMASLLYKNKQYETQKKSDILMAALEKNADINVQDFLNKLNPPRKSFEEKMKTMLTRTTLGRNTPHFGATLHALFHRIMQL